MFNLVCLPCFWHCAAAGDGWEQWQHHFDAPPVAAYTAGSGRIDLLAPEQLQHAAVQGGSEPVAPAYGARLPHKAGCAGSSSSDVVILVSQNGSVFGISAAHLTLDAANNGAAAAVVAAGEQCQMPPGQLLDQSSSDKSRAVALLAQASTPAAGLEQGRATQCKPAGQDMCSARPLHVYPVQHVGRSSLLLLPPRANESIPATARSQQQAGVQDAQRSWLVLLVGMGFGAAASATVLCISMSRRQLAAGKSMAVLQRTLAACGDGNAAVTVDASAAGKGRRRRPGINGRQGQQMSNRLRGLMQQVALDASVNAASDPDGVQPQQQPEMQQIVLRHHRQVDDTQPSSAAVAAGLADPSMRRRMVKDGVILVGRMQVCHLLFIFSGLES